MIISSRIPQYENILQMHLHKGVTLDWGSSGLADDTAAAWTMTDGKRTNSPITAASHSYEPFNDNDNRYVEGDAVNVGVTGEEAMAQALIVGRAEQAFLEDRARAGDRSLVRIRGEALHLRAVLERWHADFVSPALAALRQRKMNQTDMPRKGRIVNGKELLERKLLAATADLLGASEEVTVLKREITALRALVARLQQDEVREGYRLHFYRGLLKLFNRMCGHVAACNTASDGVLLRKPVFNFLSHAPATTSLIRADDHATLLYSPSARVTHSGGLRSNIFSTRLSPFHEAIG